MCRSANGAGASAPKLSIKLAAGGGTEVIGLTKFSIDTSELTLLSMVGPCGSAARQFSSFSYS